jgi:hypothetical protein
LHVYTHGIGLSGRVMMMDQILISEIGSFSMGFLVIWIAFYFFNRSQTFTAAEFGEFIAVFFGGTILNIYTTQLSEATRFVFWFYPIGLVIGMFAYHFIGGGNITVQEIAEPTRKFGYFVLLTIFVLAGFGAILFGLAYAGFTITLYDIWGLGLFFIGIAVIVTALKFIRYFRLNSRP